MENVHLVLVGMELQSAGILFLQHGIHFSLNLVIGIVMNVTTVVCTLPEYRKGTLASQFSTAKRMWWGKYMKLDRTLQGTGCRVHIQPAWVCNLLPPCIQVKVCYFFVFLSFTVQDLMASECLACILEGCVTLGTIIRDEIFHLSYIFTVLFKELQHIPYFDIRMLDVGTNTCQFKWQQNL